MSRSVAGLLVVLAVLLTGCAGGGSAQGVAVPDSPVGKQLQWYMDAVNRAPIPEKELTEHLGKDFLADVPPAEFNEVAKPLAGLKLDAVQSAGATEMAGVTSIPLGQQYDTKISVGADGKIDYLLLDPR